MTMVCLGLFWVMQVVATVLIKYGSTTPSRWLVGFVLGNVLLVASVWLLMKVYAQMNPHIALALAGGGSFILAQIAIAIVFHSRPTPMQWVGIIAMAAGMAVTSSMGRK